MGGIDELKQMLSSRSTEYGKMSQILSWYLLSVDGLIFKMNSLQSEVDKLRSLVIELANSLGAADETIRGCAKALGATDFTDSQYRGNLLNKADKWRKAEGDCQK